ADSRVGYGYGPRSVKHYWGEKAIPPNGPAVLLREEESRKRVVAELANWVVKPANESGGYGMLIGPRATAEEKVEMAAAVESNPRNYIAQPVLALSTAPTLGQDEIETRHLDLPPAILPDQRTLITTGGLPRVALRPRH